MASEGQRSGHADRERGEDRCDLYGRKAFLALVDHEQRRRRTAKAMVTARRQATIQNPRERDREGLDDADVSAVSGGTVGKSSEDGMPSILRTLSGSRPTKPCESIHRD
ncbi:hypothetical protein [Phytoactinopolyspora endophytica]|uniref:hypothetical protein n=1 Tax=Phytoactinopolyspora endophytica TaxID=1642495 RepID=UPI0013EBEB98|nr:hypothetical protein [Phytoactinopolyspora endophytica]